MPDEARGRPVLDDLRIERYARHILLREVGGVGQEKILAAGVRIDGLDEAGCWAATYLALAGVGRLSLADPRPVPSGGLLPLVAATEEGAPRDLAVAAALPAFNPDTLVETRTGAAPKTGASCRIRVEGAGTGDYVLASGAGGAFVGWIDGPVCEACLRGEDS
ncbi:MAG TPA: ThiF family adenylyltransferase, partial [Vulgatibacter sp.]